MFYMPSEIISKKNLSIYKIWRSLLDHEKECEFFNKINLRNYGGEKIGLNDCV